MSSLNRKLPAILAEIEELAGRQAALDFARAFGGTRFYVSRDPSPDGRLARAVGLEAATAIAEHFSTGRTGVEIDVPTGPECSYLERIASRRRLAATMMGQGSGSTAIAIHLGITRRSAQRMLASIREEQQRALRKRAQAAAPAPR